MTDGRALLGELLKANPALGEGITAKALCLPLTVAAGESENTSPLYCLCWSPDGRALLGELLKANPALGGDITEALCLPLPAAAGELENTSPLYCLRTTPDGQALLRELLETNPALGKGTEPHSVFQSVIRWTQSHLPFFNRRPDSPQPPAPDEAKSDGDSPTRPFEK